MATFSYSPTPIPSQVNFIHIDIRIPPPYKGWLCQSSIWNISFLVQLTDRCRRCLTVSQRLCNILHSPDRYPSQVHLNESFLHAAFPPAVPLNDDRLKGNPLELWHLQGDIPESGGKVSAVVAATVAPLLFHCARIGPPGSVSLPPSPAAR